MPDRLLFLLSPAFFGLLVLLLDRVVAAWKARK